MIGLLAPALVGCQEEAEEEALVAFVEGIGKRVDENKGDCEALGAALGAYFDEKLKEPLTTQLRRVSVSQKRYDEATEARLEASLRKLSEHYTVCGDSAEFNAAMNKLKDANSSL